MEATFHPTVTQPGRPTVRPSCLRFRLEAAANEGAILTLVDRPTRKCWAWPLTRLLPVESGGPDWRSSSKSGWLTCRSVLVVALATGGVAGRGLAIAPC